jgi:hypothetical protein
MHKNDRTRTVSSDVLHNVTKRFKIGFVMLENDAIIGEI